jgi:AcrR family transcriptional regulator
MASQPRPIHDREPLTRERVLQAAVRLADGSGIEAVSMRRLGQELGVEAMSLYNHVARKDDLQAGMIELVLSEVEPPAVGGNWKDEIRRTSVSSYQAFLRHRWACGLMMRGPTVSAVRMQWTEAVLRTLRTGGFSADLTHHAYHAVDSHITGFTLWVVSMPFETHDELVDLAEAFLPRISTEEFPYLIEHAQQHLLPPDPDEKPEFEFGLDLILDGLERLRDAEQV